MTLPDHTAFGCSERLSSCLCVKVSLGPSRIVTVIKFMGTDSLVVDIYMIRKWRVAPESNIAQLFMSLRLKLIVLNILVAACVYSYMLVSM